MRAVGMDLDFWIDYGRATAVTKVGKSVTISGKAGDDAKKYQERAVRKAIEESKS